MATGHLKHPILVYLTLVTVSLTQQNMSGPRWALVLEPISCFLGSSARQLDFQKTRFTLLAWWRQVLRRASQSQPVDVQVSKKVNWWFWALLQRVVFLYFFVFFFFCFCWYLLLFCYAAWQLWELLAWKLRLSAGIHLKIFGASKAGRLVGDQAHRIKSNILRTWFTTKNTRYTVYIRKEKITFTWH